MKYLSVLLLILCICADAQGNVAQQAYAIFEQSCLNCHGKGGAFTEQLILEHSKLIEEGHIIPGNPEASEFYQRLIETAPEKRMPLGQPPLPNTAIQTIRRWIEAGAPDWTVKHDINFITTDTMLETIKHHKEAQPQRGDISIETQTLLPL